MGKFHINPETGEPGPCSAKPGNCRFGQDDDHYTSSNDARKGYEAQMSGDKSTLAGIKKYKPSIKEKISAAKRSHDNFRKIKDPANGYITKEGNVTAEGRKLAKESPEAAAVLFGVKKNQ